MINNNNKQPNHYNYAIDTSNIMTLTHTFNMVEY